MKGKCSLLLLLSFAGACGLQIGLFNPNNLFWLKLKNLKLQKFISQEIYHHPKSVLIISINNKPFNCREEKLLPVNDPGGLRLFHIK